MSLPPLFLETLLNETDLVSSVIIIINILKTINDTIRPSRPHHMPI